MDGEAMAGLIEGVARMLKPYDEGFLGYARLPQAGVDRAVVLAEMARLKALETARYDQGYVSGTVYYSDAEYSDFLNRAYALHASSNPLHPDVWPSATKFEAEIVAMTAAMLGADETADDIVGTISSGGTESILLAMKTYRDWGRAVKGVAEPEVVVPSTAHVAFDKAAHLFDLRLVRVPVGEKQVADVGAMRAAITPRTVALVGSAPPYPHGLIDPIPALAEVAQAHGLGLHVDACLGGFLLPWATRLGYPVPAFDFRLPGVTSMSADTHKYGYAPKGTSVILYRGAELRRFQYFTVTDWPGGIYLSPTLAGSRPGGLSAACWAALVSIGEAGYLAATRRILDTAAWLKAQLRTIPEVSLIGDPLFVLAFRSETLDIYQLMEAMAARGWRLTGLTQPPAVHFMVALPHTQPGVKERFIHDLREAVAYVQAHPDAPAGLGPLYGLGVTVETRDMAAEMLNLTLDLLYAAEEPGARGVSHDS